MCSEFVILPIYVFERARRAEEDELPDSASDDRKSPILLRGTKRRHAKAIRESASVSAERKNEKSEREWGVIKTRAHDRHE